LELTDTTQKYRIFTRPPLNKSHHFWWKCPRGKLDRIF
jgi:hypothetical protein